MTPERLKAWLGLDAASPDGTFTAPYSKDNVDMRGVREYCHKVGRPLTDEEYEQFKIKDEKAT